MGPVGGAATWQSLTPCRQQRDPLLSPRTHSDGSSCIDDVDAILFCYGSPIEDERHRTVRTDLANPLAASHMGALRTSLRRLVTEKDQLVDP